MEPTPTLTEVPDGPIVDLFSVTTSGAVAFVLGVAMVLVAALVISFAVIRSAKSPPPTALIVALSLLTLFSIAGGIATRSDEAWTIAAAGVGALAGSVTAIFHEGRYQAEINEKRENTDPPEITNERNA